MSLSIGSFTHIGRHLTLLSNTRHTPELVSNQLHCLFIGDVSGSVSREKCADIYLKHHNARYGDIIIGSDVWIGDQVIIKGPVKIGDGAVIGAGCIVTKDVKSFEVVAGVPARHIRFRFSEDKVNALEAIAWWNWSNEKIKNHVELFYNVDEFIRKFSAE